MYIRGLEVALFYNSIFFLLCLYSSTLFYSPILLFSLSFLLFFPIGVIFSVLYIDCKLRRNGQWRMSSIYKDNVVMKIRNIHVWCWQR